MTKQISFGGGMSEAPAPDQQYLRQRAMSQALIGGSQGPISGWGEGVGNLAKTAAGVFLGRKADAGEKASNEARRAALQGVLSSPDPMAALSQSSDPELQGMALNMQMAKLLKDPGETYQTLTDDEEKAAGLDPAGTYQRSSSGKVDVLSKAPDAFKPNLQTKNIDGVAHTGYYGQDGKWVEEGSTPQFPPDKPNAPPAAVATLQAMGIDPKSPEGIKMLSGSLTGGSGSEFKQANTLRDEFNTITKDFRTTQDAYQKIARSAKSGTGPGDMSLIYGFIKMLDPNTGVKEGEYASASNAQGIPDRVISLYNQAIDGQLMAPNVRAQFVAEAGNLYASQKNSYERMKVNYSDMAKRANVNPQDVVIDYSSPVDVGGPPTVPTAVNPNDRIGNNVLHYDAQGNLIP